MIGIVDGAGRALLEIELRLAHDSPLVPITAWIDTGFTGDLVLPQLVVEKLGLTPSGTTRAVLADGSRITMRVYQCYLQWFNGVKRLEVVANQGLCPLLGIGLLRARDLRIDYRSQLITLD